MVCGSGAYGCRAVNLCDLIERVVPGGAVEECFSPQYATQIKRAGRWVDVEKPLLPGYVIVVSSRLDLVIRALREIPEFTRLLKIGESFVPLTSDERALDRSPYQ